MEVCPALGGLSTHSSTGIYPHPDVPKVPNVLHVQKGVFYSPTVQFDSFYPMFLSFV